jgi:hypothetical protein
MSERHTLEDVERHGRDRRQAGGFTPTRDKLPIVDATVRALEVCLREAA